MSSKPAEQPVPIKGLEPKAPKEAVKGVAPRRCMQLKMASPSLIASLVQPIPANQLEPMAKPIAKTETLSKPQAKAQAEAKANPLLRPGVAPPIPKEEIVQPPPTPLKYARPTPDYRPRTRTLDGPTQELVKKSEKLYAYQVEQAKIENNNPYYTDKVIYTPQNRTTFYRFINDTFGKTFKLPPKVGDDFDKEACKALELAEGKQVEAFLYQKFIREYIRNAGPYRGVLVYHGLGSGKTCSAIAAAEALYGTSNKKIIVMTPFSLRSNFMNEVTFCGFRHFSMNNHWVSEPLGGVGSMSYVYAQNILSLKEKYLKSVLARPQERRVIWVADFKRPVQQELTSQEKNDIREQLMAMIDSRIKFISYNGISANELKQYACPPYGENGERMFDNAVIVIDEIHNLIRLMQGNIMPYIMEREGGRKRKIEVEPIVPGRWEPKLCGKSENYKRAYLFYKLLTDARNSKIIGLSGTPIINFPEELGILANVLAGYMECAEFNLNTTDDNVIVALKKLVEEEPRVDIARFLKGNQRTNVLISVFQEGYRRSNDKSGAYVGVEYDEDAMEGIRTIYPRIREAIQKALFGKAIRIEEDARKGVFISYPRLPIDDETFKKEFIMPDPKDRSKLTIANKVVLQKRLTGLISYYKGSKKEYMPEVTEDTVVACEMSDYVLEKYTEERKKEIAGESGKEKETADVFAAVEMFSKMKNPSSYRFRSRAICNFAFPKTIERPFPGTVKEVEEELKPVDENMEATEAISRLEEMLSPEDAEALRKQLEREAVAIAAEEGEAEEGLQEEGDEKKEEPLDEKVRTGGGEDEPQEESEEDSETSSSDEEESEEDSQEESEEEFEEDEEGDQVKVTEGGGEYEDSMVGGDNSDDEEAPPVAATRVAAPRIPRPKMVSSASSMAAAATAATKAVTQRIARPTMVKAATAAEPSVKAAVAAESSVKALEPSATAVKALEPSATAVKALEPSATAEPSEKAPSASLLTSLSSAISSVLPSTAATATTASTAATVKPIKRPTRLAVVPELSAEEAAMAAIPKQAVGTTRRVRAAKAASAAEPSAKAASAAEPSATAVKALEEKALEPAEAQLMSYKQQIDEAMRKLTETGDDGQSLYLNLTHPDKERCLKNYSTKLHLMLQKINTSHGSNLVYSQFKTVEGLGVLKLILKANGYVEIEIQGTERAPVFSQQTIESLRKGPQAEEKRFIMFTGEGSKEQRALVLNIFNGHFDKLPSEMSKLMIESGYEKDRNKFGHICWVIGITGAGAEGISLKCCRTVHIMEPYWNNVRLDQVKGRAIRICSHKDLPFEQRKVAIFTYLTRFSTEQLKSRRIDETIKNSDTDRFVDPPVLRTSDENIREVSIRKDKINHELLEVMKESAVDCRMNAADNQNVQCLVVNAKADKYMFDPNLDVDIQISGIELKEKKSDTYSEQQAQPAEQEEQAQPKDKGMTDIDVIKIKGVQYSIKPKRQVSGAIYQLFAMEDDIYERPLGTIQKDPVEGRYFGPRF